MKIRLLGSAALGVGLAALVLRRCSRVPIESVVLVTAPGRYERAVRDALTSHVRGVP